jgi:hypothetical protein
MEKGRGYRAFVLFIRETSRQYRKGSAAGIVTLAVSGIKKKSYNGSLYVCLQLVLEGTDILVKITELVPQVITYFELCWKMAVKSN